MILQVIKIAFKGNDFRKDPKGFAMDETNGFLNGMILMPFLFPSLLVILFFILGYTSLLTGPYGFFKFVFWVTFIPLSIFLYFIINTLKMIKRTNKNVADNVINVKAEVKE